MRRLALTLILIMAAAAWAQETPPPPAAPRETKVPQAVEKTLDNGLRVIVVPKPGIPLVAARLLIKTGAAADPKGKDGLAQLTAAAVTKGTKARTAEEIARGVEALGATLNAEAFWDSSAIAISVMSSNLPKALDYVADVARNATFAKKEVDRERARLMDSLQVSLQEPSQIASMAATKLIFGDEPYGHNLEGLPATVEKIKREDLVKFHRDNYRPDNAVLAFAGDVKAEDAFALAQRLFGGWKPLIRPAATFSPQAGRRDTKGRVVVIDMPESGQAAVVVGRKGIRRTDPAYLQAMVANSVLGGGYSSRLNQEIRIKRGLSYGASSSVVAREHVGPVVASTETKHESAAEVAGIITSEMNRLGTSDVADTELGPRKASLIGDFVFSLETSSGIVNQVSSLARYGLPLSDINRYIPGVQSVKAEEVKQFATSHLGSSDVNIVVAGDAKAFIEPLRKQYEDVEVIKVDELDLSSPTLRVRKKKN